MYLSDTETPIAYFKKVAEEIKEEANNADVNKVDEFLNDLEDIKVSAKKGPGVALHRVKRSLAEFHITLKDTSNFSADLDSVEKIRVFNSWYRSSVFSKLNAFNDETDVMSQLISVQSEILTATFDDLMVHLSTANDTLANKLRPLTGLSDEVMNISGKLRDSAALEEFDTAYMERACDLNDIDDPLDYLNRLKYRFGPSLTVLKDFIEKLIDFIEDAPRRIKKAFDIPISLFCMQPCISTQASPLKKDLLKKLEFLEAIDLSPLVEKITRILKVLEGIDVESVKICLETFSSAAKDKVVLLSHVVRVTKETPPTVCGMFKLPL